jgi:hypothetical protein
MDRIEKRITENPELEAYRVEITADWPNMAEHVDWIETAPVAEIISWAESMRD